MKLLPRQIVAFCILLSVLCINAAEQEMLSDQWAIIEKVGIKEWNETDRTIWEQVHNWQKTFNKSVVMPEEAIDFLNKCILAASSQELKAALSDEVKMIQDPHRVEKIYEKKAAKLGVARSQYEALTILFGPESEAADLIIRFEKAQPKEVGPFGDGISTRRLYGIYADYAAEELGIKEKNSGVIDKGKLAYWVEIYKGGSKADARHAEEIVNLKLVKDELEEGNGQLRDAIEKLDKNTRKY